MTGGHEGGPHSGDSPLTGRGTPTAAFLSPPCEHAAEGGGLRLGELAPTTRSAGTLI